MPIYKKKIDNNQNEIVSDLEKIPGMTVKKGHDDILIGYRGFTFWIEIKSDLAVSKKTGKVLKSQIKKSQKDILNTFTGAYLIASSYNQIIEYLVRFFDRIYKDFVHIRKPITNNLKRFLK